MQIDEISGDQYADLTQAQRAALPPLADSLGSVIRDLLERGILVNVNGKIIPNPEKLCRSLSTRLGAPQNEKTM